MAKIDVKINKGRPKESYRSVLDRSNKESVIEGGKPTKDSKSNARTQHALKGDIVYTRGELQELGNDKDKD